jgi:hypothetical protein
MLGQFPAQPGERSPRQPPRLCWLGSEHRYFRCGFHLLASYRPMSSGSPAVAPYRDLHSLTQRRLLVRWANQPLRRELPTAVYIPFRSTVCAFPKCGASIQSGPVGHGSRRHRRSWVYYWQAIARNGRSSGYSSLRPGSRSLPDRDLPESVPNRRSRQPLPTKSQHDG